MPSLDYERIKSQVLLRFGVFAFGQKGSDKIISIISSDRDNWFMWVSSPKQAANLKRNLPKRNNDIIDQHSDARKSMVNFFSDRADSSLNLKLF